MEGEDIGFLRYSGKLVDDGLLDARKSAQALVGFDEAVRFFVGKQVPALAELNYELPVSVRQGSWEIHIPQTIGQWVETGLGTAATAYLGAAAAKMAQNDFKGIGLKTVFEKSLIAIQWTIRIGKHCGDIVGKNFQNVRFRNGNSEVGILGANGEYLFVPKEYFDLYVVSSPKLLGKIAGLVEDERSLTIAVRLDGSTIEESLPKRFRHVFTQEESEPEDIVLPELVHGQKVRLDGEVTRGNETSNTMGFQYKGHILTCFPENGSVVKFKASLFLKARITGIVSRLDEHGKIAAKRPKIIISRVRPLETDDVNRDLFDQ